MKKWFVNNYKLIKLNGILLLTLTFFLVLQLISSCNAVTQTELDAKGETVQEWATKIYNHFDIKKNDKLYFVAQDVVNNVNVYKFYCIPVLTSNTTFLSANVSGGNGNNWGFNVCEYLNNIVNFDLDKLYINNVNNITIFNLDYDYNNGVYYSSNFVTNGATSNAFRNNVYKTSNDYLTVNNYCNIVSSHNKGFGFEDKIIYTNIKNYIKTVRESGFSTAYEVPAKILDFDKAIKIYDYKSYLNFGSDELGSYITLKNDLKNTNVANIVFSGNSVMNGTSYTASTMMNFDLLRIYGNGDVTVFFKDVTNTVIYTCTINFSGNEIGNDTQENFDLINRFDVYFEFTDNLSYDVVGKNAFNYYGSAKMFFNLIDEFGNVINVNQLNDDNYTYELKYRYKYKYVDSEISDFTKYFNLDNFAYDVESGYYFLKLDYGGITTMFVDLAIFKTDSNGNTFIDNSIIYGFTLIKSAGVGVFEIYSNGKYINFDDLKPNNISSSNIFIKDKNNNSISDVDIGIPGYSEGNIINTFTNGLTIVVETITSTIGLLLGSTAGIALLFGQAFSWLPSPIPQLVTFAFVAVIIFALIRWIRGH